jgi:hypothetical protein
MKRLLTTLHAAMMLIGLTTGLHAEEGDYCSGQAIMSDSWDDATQTGRMSITENGKTEVWERGASVGTGLNGMVYSLDNDAADTEVLLTTSILMDANTSPPDEPMIKIFRDRVFWPCDRKK